jgi:dephospho-CoA kinase
MVTRRPVDKSAKSVFRVGLTGGIASGKTTIANMFGELGAILIDTDLIARNVVAPGTEGLQAIVKAFGDEVLAPDGTLDRRALRSIVFSDETRRRELESITHPRIRAETTIQMHTFGGPYQIIVVPLLVESPLRNAVNRVLVVDCSREVQLARLLQRDAESYDQAERMIASQASREERLALADDVIDNNADLDNVRRQVRRLHRKYLLLAA